MIALLFITIAALVAWADFRAFVKIAPKKLWTRLALIVLFVVLNTLNIIPILTNIIVDDNTQTVINFSSWALTIYTIATLTRLAFYAGFLLFRNIVRGVIVGSVLGIITLSILCNSLFNTRTNLDVRYVDIHNSNIPESFSGFKIALFSDLHIGSLLNAESEISTLVEAINKEDVDMVLFAGDMLHIRAEELTDSIASTLAEIKARNGVYAVLGNHDTGVYIKDTIKSPKDRNIAELAIKYEQMGWRLLRDSTIYVVKGADSIAVTGVDFTDALLEYKHSFSTPDNFKPEAIFAQVDKGMFNIAISHLPQLWQPISQNECADLTLAGHIHATQIAARIFGKRLSPAMLMYREWSGLYNDGKSSLYITDGIGSVGFYLRIGANPELTILTLNR